MTDKNFEKIKYSTPSIKEYGSVSDLVGGNFGGAGNPDGAGTDYNS